MELQRLGHVSGNKVAVPSKFPGEDLAMPSAQPSVQQKPGDQEPGQMDDFSAAIAQQTGYYDPDSAAYHEDAAVPVMGWLESNDEGIPVRELVTA
jgi:hypothetical protein